MIVRKENCWPLVALLPLFVVTSAIAAPTTSGGCHYEAGTLSADRVAEIQSPLQFATLGKNCSPYFAGIGAELLRPPQQRVDSATSTRQCARALPAVPGAILMVLAGFVCVSLVRDRKMWLAAAACLLSLGQTGLAILPQLAAQLRSKEQVEEECRSKLTPAYNLDGIDRLRSDVEGTRYIGLLRHLAGIPRNRLATWAKWLAPRAVQPRNLRGLPEDTHGADTRLRLGESESAITTSSLWLVQAASSLIGNTEEHVCFSPAFTFNSLARGPPR